MEGISQLARSIVHCCGIVSLQELWACLGAEMSNALLQHHACPQARCLAPFPGLFGQQPQAVGRGRCWRRRRPQAASSVGTAQAAPGAQLTQHFAELAAALAPGTCLKADYTPLGRGLVATAPVAAGTPMLAVDWANLLCVTDDPSKPAGSAFGKRVLQDWQLLHGKIPPLLSSYLLTGEGGWFLRLTAWMLFLCSRVEAGPLALYKQLLPTPEEMCCLMNYLPEERGHLQSPALEALAAKERGDILGVHERMFSSEGGELRALRLAPSPGNTVWAASLVNSRCFSETVDGEVVSLVVPCADMANHWNTPNSVYGFSTERDCFEILSLRDIAAGEEVCISYGCQGKSNDELMRDYGFSIPANKNDRIPFATGTDILSQLQAGGSSTPLVAIHAGVLAGAVESALSASRLSPSTAARLPAVLESFWPFLRQETVPGSGFNALVLARLAAAAGLPAGSSQAGPGSQNTGALATPSVPPPSEAQLQAERAAVAALQEQCGRMLAAHGTSAATDEALLRGEGAKEEGEGELMGRPRVRQAVECRLERKRLIGAAAEVLGMYGESLR